MLVVVVGAYAEGLGTSSLSTILNEGPSGVETRLFFSSFICEALFESERMPDCMARSRIKSSVEEVDGMFDICSC